MNKERTNKLEDLFVSDEISPEIKLLTLFIILSFDYPNGKQIEYNEHLLLRGKCSICGWKVYLYEEDIIGIPYCPNCGSKMIEVIDEEDYKE